jgi:hypothetical protein
VTTIDVSVKLTIVPNTPLNWTLVGLPKGPWPPGSDPVIKYDPVNVTVVLPPVGPVVGDMPVIEGK